jgi:hypothetical protein
MYPLTRTNHGHSGYSNIQISKQNVIILQEYFIVLDDKLTLRIYPTTKQSAWVYVNSIKSTIYKNVVNVRQIISVPTKNNRKQKEIYDSSDQEKKYIAT